MQTAVQTDLDGGALTTAMLLLLLLLLLLLDCSSLRVVVVVTSLIRCICSAAAVVVTLFRQPVLSIITQYSRNETRLEVFAALSWLRACEFVTSSVQSPKHNHFISNVAFVAMHPLPVGILSSLNNAQS